MNARGLGSGSPVRRHARSPYGLDWKLWRGFRSLLLLTLPVSFGSSPLGLAVAPLRARSRRSRVGDSVVRDRRDDRRASGGVGDSPLPWISCKLQERRRSSRDMI